MTYDVCVCVCARACACACVWVCRQFNQRSKYPPEISAHPCAPTQPCIARSAALPPPGLPFVSLAPAASESATPKLSSISLTRNNHGPSHARKHSSSAQKNILDSATCGNSDIFFCYKRKGDGIPLVSGLLWCRPNSSFLQSVFAEGQRSPPTPATPAGSRA